MLWFLATAGRRGDFYPSSEYGLVANDENAEEKLWGAQSGMAFVDYLLACIAAVLLHEMAHVLAAWASGIRVKRVGMTWKGPYIVREQGPPFANLCIALAGPVLNLALALSFWTFAPHFRLVNLALGGYNLLPFIRGLDGYHALAAYRKLRVSAAVAPDRSSSLQL